MRKQTFIQGTIILLLAGIINRMLGFIPRIALPRIIGAEGVGLYQLGYPFFIVLITVITGESRWRLPSWLPKPKGKTARSSRAKSCKPASLSACRWALCSPSSPCSAPPGYPAFF